MNWKIGKDFPAQVVARFGTDGALIMRAEGDAVVHHRMDRIKRGAAHDAVDELAVAVAHPLVALVADAGIVKCDVRSAAPSGVYVVQPKRRGPGAGRSVDKELRTDFTQIVRDVEEV